MKKIILAGVLSALVLSGCAVTKPQNESATTSATTTANESETYSAEYLQRLREYREEVTQRILELERGRIEAMNSPMYDDTCAEVYCIVREKHALEDVVTSITLVLAEAEETA